MRELRAAGQRVIAPAALTTCTALHQLAPETRLPWYPVYSLSRQQVCYVPAAAIFPTSSLNAGHMFERVQAGASAGTTFQELFQAGLRSALIYEHVRRLMRGEEKLIRLNPAEPGEQDRDLAFLLRGARHSGHTISLFEIAHEAPLHVVLACTETAAGELTAIGAGFSGPAALSDALRLLLGDLQVVLATGELPVSRDARTLVSPRAEFLFADPAVSRFAAPACTFEDLEAYTRANGWEILCANTTPSDLWMTRTWMSGTLLLASHGEDADDTASL
jgi:hypothetical protein